MKDKTKFDTKDATIISLIILCLALIIVYFNLAGSYNSLTDLYIDNCYIQPIKNYATGITYNLTGII